MQDTWKSEVIHHESITGEQYDEVLVFHENGKPICVMIGEEDEWIPNSNLISQAPKMHELLQRVKSLLENTYIGESRHTADEIEEEIDEIDQNIRRIQM